MTYIPCKVVKRKRRSSKIPSKITYKVNSNCFIKIDGNNVYVTGDVSGSVLLKDLISKGYKIIYN